MRLIFNCFIFILFFNGCDDDKREAQRKQVINLIEHIYNKDINGIDSLVAGDMNRVGITDNTLSFWVTELSSYIHEFGLPRKSDYQIKLNDIDKFKDCEIEVKIGGPNKVATLTATFLKVEPKNIFYFDVLFENDSGRRELEQPSIE